MNYYNYIQSAIDTADLIGVRVAVSVCQVHYNMTLIDSGEMMPHHDPKRRVAAHHVLESRSRDDLTPLAYTCLAYHDAQRSGQADRASKLADIAAFLLECGANPTAEVCRPIVRTHTALSHKPTYRRGEGKSVLEVLGVEKMPEAIQDAISDRPEVYEPTIKRSLSQRSTRGPLGR